MVPNTTPRPCERFCKECKQPLHYSRFRSWKDSRVSTGSGIQFAQICKACEQKNRNEEKNSDRPLAIIEQRAAARAAKLNKSREFVMTDMGWRNGLVPLMRLYLKDGICRSCGHKFLNERDIQIEHILPPRHQRDFANEHARNLQILCGSCNRTKTSKDFQTWLDEQENARISNIERKDPPEEPPAPSSMQLSLFD